MDRDGDNLWQRVIATVRKLGSKQTVRNGPKLCEIPAATVLDLHGYTVQQAHALARSFVENTPHSEVLIITGKSGQINHEFWGWFADHDRVQYMSEQNNGGAFRLKIDKRAGRRK